MRPFDPPLLAIASGTLAVRVGTTDLVFRYLRPSMRPWLIASGVVLLALGAIALWDAWQRTRPHKPVGSTDPAFAPDQVAHAHEHHATWLCWLLLLPVALGAIVDPRALGAASVSQNRGARQAFSEPFDLQNYLATHTTGGQAPQLTMAQYITAARNPADRDALNATEIRLLGFVVPHPTDPARRLFSRLQVGCCAADAVPLVVEVTVATTSPNARSDAPRWPEANQWVEITAKLDGPLTDGIISANTDRVEQFAMAAVTASAVRLVDAPEQPYEYP